MKQVKRMITVLGLVLILGISVFLGSHTIEPTGKPSVDEDDYIRTLEHVRNIARDIHESGSESILIVREYLKTQFDQLGVSYSEEPFIGDGWNGKQNIEMINLFIKIDCADTEEGVLFVSHYDSTPYGPGAADDGISVAAMLTALQKVRSMKDLRNDIYFLFTDGEELHSLGANVFVKSHPELKERIKLVINLEARGNEGPLLMFETSDNNLNVMRELNRAVDHITAFSFTAQIYKQMPNGTDLTDFLVEDYTGINFSVVDGGESYHKPEDHVDQLKRDTAYMYYATTAQLAEYFGRSDLHQLEAQEDAVYFPFLKGNMIIIPAKIALWVEIIGLLLGLLWWLRLSLKKRIKRKEIMRSVGVFAVTLVVAFITAWIERIAVRFLLGDLSGLSDHEMVQIIENLNFVLMVLMILVTTIVLHLWGFKWTRNPQAFAMTLGLLMMLITGILIIAFSSMAYLFFIPSVLLIIGSMLQQYISNSILRRIVFWVYTLSSGLILSVILYPVIASILQVFYNEFYYGYATLECLYGMVFAFAAVGMREENIWRNNFNTNSKKIYSLEK